MKTIRSQKLRMLLTHRKLLQSKAIAIENDLRGTLRNFGLKVGVVGKVNDRGVALIPSCRCIQARSATTGRSDAPDKRTRRVPSAESRFCVGGDGEKGGA